MRKYIILSITFLCFWSCVARQNGTESKTGAIQTSATSNEVEGSEQQTTYTTPNIKIGSSNCLGIGRFQVTKYTDGKLESRSLYRDGLVTESVFFSSGMDGPTTEVEYFYNDKEELDRQKVVRGNDVDISEEMLLENRQALKEIRFQCEYLQSKGIRFPLADIVANDMSDLTTVLSVAEKNSDFKTETQTNVNQKAIKFIGFNKTSRFHNSPIALLIGKGDFINIKDYELTLENSFPLKEVYRTGDGDLTKTYSYKNEKLFGVVYQFTDLKNQTNSIVKRFEYHELK